MRARPTCHMLPVLLAISLASALPGYSQSREVLFQTSTLEALMAGIYDGPVTIRHLLEQGDFGLGTFNRLDGEMVVLDGKCYQVTAEGRTRRVTGSRCTPFAVVTFFDREISRAVTGPLNLAELSALIDGMLPSPNLFYAVRIEGEFTLVKTRSVPAQHRPYPKLTEVVVQQPTFELCEVHGTLVGFRCPSYMAGLNVPGYHLHFLTEDRSRGGHVLEVAVKQAQVTLDTTPELRLALPQTTDFCRHDFAAGGASEIDVVEKGQ